MVCRSPVNLRGRLGGVRIGATEVSNLSGLHVAQVSVRRNDDPISVGVMVKGQLDAGIAGEDPVRDILGRFPGKQDAFSEPTLDVVNVSNLGNIPELPRPTGLELSDFRIMTQKSGNSQPGYVAYSYAGRLGIQVVCRADLYTEEQVGLLVGGLDRQLQEILKPSYSSQHEKGAV
jgi:hypothetical protein